MSGGNDGQALTERGARQAGQQLASDPLERFQGMIEGFDRSLAQATSGAHRDREMPIVRSSKNNGNTRA
jgi:hypothetical protein